jgi:hypothetical protein
MKSSVLDLGDSWLYERVTSRYPELSPFLHQPHLVATYSKVRRNVVNQDNIVFALDSYTIV